MEGTDVETARNPSARAMPIDTTVTATRVESASASVANSSIGLGEGLCVGLVNMKGSPRIRGRGVSRSSIRIPARVRPDLGEALVNRGDFVNLVTKVLTP